MLYPRVLLCSLKIKVFCQLSKIFLDHSSFKRLDSINGITESVVLLGDSSQTGCKAVIKCLFFADLPI